MLRPYAQGENIWQARFYDHVIGNRKDYEEHIKYIQENPARWYLDGLYKDDYNVGVDVLGDPQNVELLSHGMVADKYIKQMNEFYENLTVDQYVIMPNHIHLILFVHEDGSPRTSTPTKQTSFVSHFVSTFKRFCNKEYGENIWQRGFYDHVIRGRKDYEEIAKYIYENPVRWYYDELYAE